MKLLILPSRSPRRPKFPTRRSLLRSLALAAPALILPRKGRAWTHGICVTPSITSDGGGSTAAITKAVGVLDITTVIATGTGPMVYSISGGADAALFSIDASTGALTLMMSEPAADYIVIVMATGACGFDTQTITLTVAAAYHASAVHFDTNTRMHIDSLTSPDSSVVSGSAWFKGAFTSGQYIQLPEYDDANTGSNLTVYAPSLGDQWYWTDQVFTDQIAGESADNVFTQNAWHHILYSFDLSAAAGSRLWAVYLDDILISQTTTFDNGAGSVVLSFNGKDVYFPSGLFPTNTEFDIADMWFAPNVSLLSGSTISEGTRRLFIDGSGKPVNPVGFPASAMLFSGDHITFSVNQGSGGPFTLTGTLTDASTSPSD